MTTTTHRTKANRSRWWRDRDGVLTTVKRQDETIKEALDVNPELDGETIASTAWGTSGPTITGTANASGIVTWAVTGSGYATLKVTTSGARVLHYRMHWQASDQGVSDYA